MYNSKHLPQSINTCLRKLEGEPLPLLIREGVFADENRKRGIRSDYLRSIKTVLLFLVRHYDLATGQLVFPVAQGEYVTLTPSLIAERTNLCSRTVKRVLKYLLGLGLVGKEGQRKPLHIHNLNGEHLLLTSIFRRLEDKLFAVLGILPMLKADRAGRLNRILKVRRLKATRFVLHQRTTETPISKPKPPPPQKGLTSLKDLFRRAKDSGIPIPEHLL